MKSATDKFDSEYMPSGPRSVFYRGRNHCKRKRLRSFKTTEEVQRVLENQRYRKEKKP